MRNEITFEMWQIVIFQSAKGKSYSKIARLLRINKNTIPFKNHNWIESKKSGRLNVIIRRWKENYPPLD